MSTHEMAETQPPASGQGSYFYILTLSQPGKNLVSLAGGVTPPPGSTRQSVYEEIRRHEAQIRPWTAEAAVLFFSLEPNQL